MKIENSKVLIIGGSSGLGLGIAKSCASNGAHIIIASRHKQKMLEAADKIDGEVFIEIVDILSSVSIVQLFKRVGRIDHLIVSSGCVTGKQFHALSEEDAKKDFEVNFWGKFNTAKQAANFINNAGTITFISGAFAKKPNPDVFMTSVSVSAIETMVKMLAVSLSPIRVNALAPYVVDASSNESMPPDKNRKLFLDSTANNIPSKYIGTTEDIGNAAVFLMSNPYVTASTLAIDGGFTVI